MESSGLKGASAVIRVGPCKVLMVMFIADADKTPTLTLYDNATEGSGTEIGILKASNYLPMAVLNFPGRGKHCASGLYASLSAAEGDYIILTEPL